MVKPTGLTNGTSTNGTNIGFVCRMETGLANGLEKDLLGLAVHCFR